MSNSVAVTGGVRQQPPGAPDAPDVSSRRKLARVAGVFYLLVVLLGVFAEFVVRASVTVSGDPEATARNVADAPAMMWAAFGADLAMITSFLLLGLLLYAVFSHVNNPAAIAMVTFVAVTGAVMYVNMLNHLAALLTATDPTYAAAFGLESPGTLPALFLDFHAYGYTIAQIAFGLWLLPLGYLGLKSGLFPRWLSVLAIVACASHLLAMPLSFTPALDLVVTLIAVPSVVGEFALCGYLLIKGVKVARG